MLSLNVFVSLTLSVVILWRVFRQYFQKSPFRNIPGPARTSFIKGNMKEIFDHTDKGWDFLDENSQRYSQVFSFHEVLGATGLYVYDPKALHHIVVKEQAVFEEPRWFISWNLMIHGPGLLSTLHDQHRKQRRVLNPVFSIAHMRHMTPIFYGVMHRLRSAMERQLDGSSSEADMLGWMGRAALELVGQGGLGYSFDPLLENRPNEFGDAVKRLVPLGFTLQFWRMLSPYFMRIGTPNFRRFFSNFVPTEDMKKMRHVVQTLSRKANEIYEEKRLSFEKGDEAVTRQIGEGKDILSVLMKANMESAVEDRLTREEVVAQMSTLVFAAMDTTSNALSRILQLLAQHQDVQKKLRAELFDASESEDISYDQLTSLPYLDAVCRETLRLYPPVTFLFRETRDNAMLPLSQPIYGNDGSEVREIFVPKETSVVVGIRACNRNKNIWGEDALEWKPERWLSALPTTVTESRVPGVYSNLMTFLGGGRACIGFKFSQLEMKVVLAVLLRSFKFSPSDKNVVWNLSGVSFPTVGYSSTKPAMPLVVEPVKKP